LQSKISVPGLPAWTVPRPRLEKRIAHGTQGPLTSITGPPGTGKTLAAASWAAGYGLAPVAWVTLDAFDNRPEVFWSYVMETLRHTGLAVTRAAAALKREGTAGHSFLLEMASALADHHPAVTLVLDDFHLVTDEAVLAGLVYVLKNATGGLRLVVASRVEPPLPLHQYRLTGDLTEVRADDLAFSVHEAALLMAQHSVTLSRASLGRLTEQNEGWAAGLRMAAMAMAGHSDPEEFVQNLAADDSAVAGYLVKEVLNPQPADVRKLLLYTSILEQVNAEIAGALLGRGQAAGPLEALARENAFVQPTGNGWYRLHTLFRGVLRQKLRREKPEIVADLHRRAARWYQQDGQAVEAVRSAAKADDWQLAASILVDELAIGLLLGPCHGDLPTDGFRVVPDGDASPQFLLAAAATALSECRNQAAEALLAAAEAILRRRPDREVLSRFAACTIRCSLAFRDGSLDALDAATTTAETLLDKIPQTLLTRHPHGVAQVVSCRAAVELWSGNLGKAADLFAEAVRLLEDAVHDLAPGHPDLAARRNEAIACRGYLALTEALRGRLNSAMEIVGPWASLLGGGRAGQPDPVSALALAFVCLEQGELNASRVRLKIADAALCDYPDRLAGVVGCLVAARGSLAEGRTHAVLEVIEATRRGWSPPPLLDRMLALTESQAYAACGNGAAALDAARRAGPTSVPDARVTLSRAWLAAGDAAEARRTLAAVLETSPAEAPERIRLDALLADALFSFRGGDEARGRRSLDQALRLGEEERRWLPFAIEREWMQPALARHPELAAAHAQLLGPALIAHAPRKMAPVIVQQLSDRERDVLRHVGEMLDTADIAAELYISVNTVKTHLKSIFRKLGAGDRREAVRRARQLNML
jgi:LuxR family maltose regulon positive regulatory protein